MLPSVYSHYLGRSSSFYGRPSPAVDEKAFYSGQDNDNHTKLSFSMKCCPVRCKRGSRVGEISQRQGHRHKAKIKCTRRSVLLLYVALNHHKMASFPPGNGARACRFAFRCYKCTIRHKGSYAIEI